MARRYSRALVLLILAGWSGACRAPEPLPAERPAATVSTAPAALSTPPLAWASAPDCQAKLQLLEQAVAAGRLSPTERPPIAVVLPGDAGGWDWLALPSVKIAADLPLEVHERDAAAQLDAPCLLMIDQPRDQRVGHRLIGRESVRSFYENGVRSERNPDYDAAQLRLRQAERAAKDDGLGLLKVGDPMLDLVGSMLDSLVAGFNQGSGEGEVDEAMEELIATPRSRDRAIYRAYEFERMTVLAGKEATIPIALVDRTSGQVWRAALRQRERRELAIVEGLDPRDRDYEAQSAASLTRDEFEHWLGEPPRLQLSAITAALRDATPAGAPDGTMVAAASAAPVEAAASAPDRDPPPPSLLPLPGAGATGRLPGPPVEAGSSPRVHAAARSRDLDAALALRSARSERSPPEAAPPNAAPSVVRILADERAGGGVYVRGDLVLTTAQLVERASVVDVVSAEGTRVLGLVARTDDARNLALVQVARPGIPAVLYDGPPLARGTTLEAIVPAAGGELMRRAGRYLGDGPAADLAMAATGDLAYVDAPALKDAPDAAPWFLADRLVGLGLAGAAGRPGDPHRAIRAAEIGDFLEGAGALAALR